MTATAQKLFTLEELNYGGKNYRQTLPENRNYYGGRTPW